MVAFWVPTELSKLNHTHTEDTKVTPGSHLELNVLTNIVLCFQASMLHPMKAKKPSVLIQLLVSIFHFFCAC